MMCMPVLMGCNQNWSGANLTTKLVKVDTKYFEKNQYKANTITSERQDLLKGSKVRLHEENDDLVDDIKSSHILEWI